MSAALLQLSLLTRVLGQELQRILSRSLDFLYSATDSATGLQTTCDYLLIIKTFESQILSSKARWGRTLSETKGELLNKLTVTTLLTSVPRIFGRDRI